MVALSRAMKSEPASGSSLFFFGSFFHYLPYTKYERHEVFTSTIPGESEGSDYSGI